MTDEIRRAIASAGGEPVKLVDQESQRTYVLVPSTEYERAKENEGEEIRDTYPAHEAVARAEGWDDPRMDDYNDYDAHRQQARADR